MAQYAIPIVHGDMPRAVKVGNVIYNVVRTPNIHSDDATMRVGECDFLQNTITINIDSYISGDAAHQTLMHEIMHAIVHMMGLDDKIDEDLIDKLATGVHIVATDNPHLFDIIGGISE